jgi:hypothetical protein
MLYKMDRVAELEDKVDAIADAVIEEIIELAEAVGTDMGQLAQAGLLTVQAIQEIQEDVQLLEDAALADFLSLHAGLNAITERLDMEAANKAKGAAYNASRQLEQDNRLDAAEARLDTDKALIVGLVMKSVRQARAIKALEARLDALEIALEGKKDSALVDSFMSTVSQNSTYIHNRISDTNDRVDGVIAHMNGHITDTNDKFGLVAQAFQDGQAVTNATFGVVENLFRQVFANQENLRVGGLHVAHAVQKLVNPFGWGR